MSASVSLPPSGRDFLVYQRVVAENASTRAVADEVRLSQTRVRQIVERVHQWLSATLPASEAEIDDAARLRVGQHIAADRMEFLYRDTMQQWNNTKQPKFAGLLIRIIAAQAKIPAFAGTIEALAADVIEGPLPDDAAPSSSFDLQPSSLNPPPVRDCSPSSQPATAGAEKPAQPPATNRHTSESSHNPPRAAAAARSAFLAPAHVVSDDGDDAPVTEIKITPQTLGFSTTKVFSRKERRRLRRMASAK